MSRIRLFNRVAIDENRRCSSVSSVTVVMDLRFSTLAESIHTTAEEKRVFLIIKIDQRGVKSTILYSSPAANTSFCSVGESSILLMCACRLSFNYCIGIFFVQMLCILRGRVAKPRKINVRKSFCLQLKFSTAI